MDVDKKVEDLLRHRSFSSPEARERTRQALLNTLRPIQAIRSHVDDEAMETSPEDYKQDDGDGVTCTTIAEFNTRQQEKRRALRIAAREMFPLEQGEDVATATADEDTDINRPLTWGYTLLHFAALKGDEAECDRLISLGADIYATDTSGKMPYQKAALKGFDTLAAKLKPQF